MGERLGQLYESLGTRDLLEIGVLAVAIYLGLRFLGRTRGAGLVRGLGLVVVGLFLLTGVVIVGFDPTVLGRILDYLLTTVLVGLLVIFQPELRRGLIVLGRSWALRYLARQNHPEMMLVAVSGFDDPVLRAAAADAGAAYFLKPIEFLHLKEHLAAA